MNRQIKVKSLQLALWLISACGLFLAQIAPAQTVDKIVAIVNNEVITQSEVDRVLALIEVEQAKQAKENIIQQMVEEKLILCEAKKNNIKVDDETIEQRLAKVKQGFASEEEFEKSLEASGLTLKELQDRFRDQEIMKRAVEQFVRGEIKIDPIEISQFYQAHQEEFIRPEQARVQSILIKMDESSDGNQALQKAKMVLERLRAGENFAELAKLYSQGANAQEGGDIGFIERGQLIKEIDEAIFNLNLGEFTDVIKTTEGFRIFKLGQKEAKKPLTFSQAQSAIKDILYRQKFAQRFKQWIEQLKQNADIQIKEKVPNE